MSGPLQWVELALYDIETARAMQRSGRFLYVLFCCQQAVEKAMKALVVQRTGGFPPRVHSLMRLAEAASLVVDEEQEMFLRELSNYYIETRYPEDIASLAGRIEREQSAQVLTRTEELLVWLSLILKRESE
ncbi:MAG: HEPN domain-containing protein [Candidatus Sumerlaeia bacterium]|nr:HEPN domain-containing protein [Candidatus Sumerlaeia bacterium]